MISVLRINKTFKLYRSPSLRLKEVFLRRIYHRKIQALKEITFEVDGGETLGIVGQNGAGKSTMLKVLTGVLLPDSGEIHVDGRITGLLGLGTGINAEFSGLQNIYLNGTLLGMSRGEIDQKLDAIVAFSELGDFIREPLKTYSSGMVMRLAFSTAIHADPTAFVVDEALAVGDAYFQQKCVGKIREFKKKGGSIVLVSHDMNAVKLLCDRALLLNDGAVVDRGDPASVIGTYNYLLSKKSRGEEIRSFNREGVQKAYGNLKVEITDATMLNEEGRETNVFVSGQRAVVEIHLAAYENMDDVTVGILIKDRFGQDIFGINNYHLKVPISLKKGNKCLVTYTVEELNLGPDKYSLTVAAHRGDFHIQECYHWLDAIKSFEVIAYGDSPFAGIAGLKTSLLAEIN